VHEEAKSETLKLETLDLNGFTPIRRERKDDGSHGMGNKKGVQNDEHFEAFE